MTTKPKTRKAPAKRAAPKAATKQAPGEQKREVTDIRKLVSRWHWLEADQTHRANRSLKEVFGLALTPRFRELLSQL